MSGDLRRRTLGNPWFQPEPPTRLILEAEVPGIYRRANASPSMWQMRHRADKARKEQATEILRLRRLSARVPAATVKECRLVTATLYLKRLLDDDNSMSAIKYEIDAAVEAGLLWADGRRWCRMPFTPEQERVTSAFLERVVLRFYDYGAA